MGLLDNAIREHLELKRLRGADPGLVSREENEAFGPVKDGEPTNTGDDIAASGDLAGEDAPPGSEQPEGFSNVGQETAELDMRTVLDDESDRDATSARPVTAGSAVERPSSGAPHEQGAADDSLEWEMPGDGGAHGSDGRADDDLPSGESGDEPVEDVLEETPDFLRDTPEQERLWFEQRPPRDFDFDK
ncbi:MAG TPA: hypothetical protein VG053_09445 [Solirubrobacteraceae bacterium]|jgi:hypothetical protein|nr:hypothetical protein [Solirubrobacteraceae bacterium]